MSDSPERLDAIEHLQLLRARLDELSRRYETGELLGSWVPRVDILEEEGHYRILADLPGVRPEDLELLEEGQTIVLSGIRHHVEGTYLRQERESGIFRRTLRLPGRIQPGSAQATLRGGVLEVRVQKA